ncbi:MAG: OB-fold nucleic acid binding domain-containing protein, partial [Candidatus Paceibacterota bacterium]
MSTADQVKKIRITKIKELKKQGMEVYPSHCFRNQPIGKILNNFYSWSIAKKKIWTGGRIMSIRFHGGIAFADLWDASGHLQIVFKKEETKNFELLNQYLDVSD